MGRLTEYFKYLNVEPSKLQEFKQGMCYLEETQAMKQKRLELKLYKTKSEL